MPRCHVEGNTFVRENLCLPEFRDDLLNLLLLALHLALLRSISNIRNGSAWGGHVM